MQGATDVDRRIQAYVVDRAIGWGLGLSAGAVLWFGVGEHSPLLVAAAVLGIVVLVGLACALLQGASGATPGKALVGLRTIRVVDGSSIGVGNALTRGLILATAGLPTAGLGLGALAWTAATDPAHQRRAWHDRITGSLVVDARRHVRPDVGDGRRDDFEEHRGLVNLTTLRLGPPPDSAPLLAPVARPIDPTPTVTRWLVSFDTGEQVAVSGLTLIGRDPQAREGESVRHVVRLGSDDLSLSKTHAQCRVASDGALVVMDRGSTNGSVLRRGEMVRDLHAGRPATLLEGDRVAFGDRVMLVARES